MFYRNSIIFFLFALCMHSAFASHSKLELTGTIADYAYVNPINGAVQRSTVLLLFSPITLPSTTVDAELAHTIIIELVAKDDAMLQEFSLHSSLPVVVKCEPSIATLWGYRHASCAPTSVKAAPNYSFKPSPLRGLAQRCIV